MDAKHRTSASKFLSWVLRHEPEALGLELDAAGWIAVEALLEACTRHGRSLSRAELEENVATSPKQRFALSDNGLCIRASQGHSVTVELGHAASEPPELLFHGTIAAVLPAIRREGLRRMERHHVHLSPDDATARAVAARRGAPVVLRVRARAMWEAGHAFFVTPNRVRLVEAVPATFIEGWGEV